MKLLGQIAGRRRELADGLVHQYAYYDTANSSRQQHRGVVEVDLADPTYPKPVGTIGPPIVRDPRESQHVDQARKLLCDAEVENGTRTGNGLEI